MGFSFLTRLGPVVLYCTSLCYIYQYLTTLVVLHFLCRRRSLAKQGFICKKKKEKKKRCRAGTEGLAVSEPTVL